MKEVELRINNGDKRYFIKGTDILHREDGPAIEYATGTKSWCKEGKYHRLDGPAYEGYNGDKVWFKEGKRHRLDGPAVEYFNGNKQYWIEGKQIKNVNSIEEALIKNLLE